LSRGRRGCGLGRAGGGTRCWVGRRGLDGTVRGTRLVGIRILVVRFVTLWVSFLGSGIESGRVGGKGHAACTAGDKNVDE